MLRTSLASGGMSARQVSVRSWSPRRLVSTLLWLYLAGLAFVLLNPSAEIPSQLVGFIADLGRTAEVPARLLLPGRVEFVVNALVVAPATAAAAWLWPTRSWTTWTAYGFVGALSVEAVQGLLLPGRSATHVDVVANTLGALLGAVIMLAVVHRAAAGPPCRGRARQSDGS